MAITSPPYNIKLTYDKYIDDKSNTEYLKWLEQIFKELHRILVSGGRFAINILPTNISPFNPIHHDICNILRNIGFIFRTEILWYKQNIKKRTAWGSFKSPSNPHILPSWEYVYIFCKDKWKLEGNKNYIDISNKEFIDFSNGFWHIKPETNRYGHPAPFPEELVYRLIKFYTYKYNTVLDMFGGIGTTAVVCKKLQRDYIHIDISREYCNIAKNRLYE